MPELPEVETIRRGLERVLPGKEISDLKISKPKLLRGSPAVFRRVLRKARFGKIRRRGKLLIMEVFTAGRSGKKRVGKADKKFLLIHLKMTGQLIYCDGSDFVAGGHANSRAERERFAAGEVAEFCQPGKYTHVVFEFVDGSRLFYNDLRQFGYLQVVNEAELAQIESGYGIEPGRENFTWENFKRMFTGRKTNIKAFLLDQKLISGLGNIYVDEVLFAAGINPRRTVDTLDESERKKIFRHIKTIIKRAIEAGGTTFSDYVDASGRRGSFVEKLKVYGRAGELCLRCRRRGAKSKIRKLKIAGRGTHLCPRCQR